MTVSHDERALARQLAQVRKVRPAYWTGLDISAHAYDYQGAACADASVSRTLCRDCTKLVHDAVNAAIDQARSLIQETTND